MTRQCPNSSFFHRDFFEEHVHPLKIVDDRGGAPTHVIQHIIQAIGLDIDYLLDETGDALESTSARRETWGKFMNNIKQKIVPEGCALQLYNRLCLATI